MTTPTSQPNPTNPTNPTSTPKLIYCHCAYANVIERETKLAVLQKLSEAGIAFETVADLCEMSAQNDPALKQLAEESKEQPLMIAACYPRAVKWLFHAANAPLSDNASVLNMREQSAQQVVQCMIEGKPLEESIT